METVSNNHTKHSNSIFEVFRDKHNPLDKLLIAQMYDADRKYTAKIVSRSSSDTAPKKVETYQVYEQSMQILFYPKVGSKDLESFGRIVHYMYDLWEYNSVYEG